MTMFQHTAARRRLRSGELLLRGRYDVSTHSRPKAAAAANTQLLPARRRFNTQPPEGGCKTGVHHVEHATCFNTQPPEGGCRHPYRSASRARRVSTHSRPKAAARVISSYRGAVWGFNTQPPEGGCRPGPGHAGICQNVSTHSRPKAAAPAPQAVWFAMAGFNTQPPEGGCRPARSR